MTRTTTTSRMTWKGENSYGRNYRRTAAGKPEGHEPVFWCRDRGFGCVPVRVCRLPDGKPGTAVFGILRGGLLPAGSDAVWVPFESLCLHWRCSRCGPRGGGVLHGIRQPGTHQCL